MSIASTRLPSGLTVVTDAMAHVESAALGVWVRAGGRDELAGEHGIAHLIEHMAFKGTKRRTARQVVEAIEDVGGYLNAGTGSENTSYYARVLKDDVSLALDVLADILTEPLIDAEELIREQNVVVQEIGAALDAPDQLVWDHLLNAIYPDQPLGRNILGTPQTVTAFRPDDLRGYLARTYRAPRMVVAAAGAIEHAQIVEEAERLFGGFSAEGTDIATPARFTTARKLESRDTEQVHLAFAFEGPAQGDRRTHTLRVLSTLLGGGMSSRLFQEVREKRGLCYSIFSSGWSYIDSGVFAIYAATEAAQAEELTRVVFGEMAAALDGFDAGELARAKAQIKAGWLMSLEQCATCAEVVAQNQLIHGRQVPLEEYVAELEAVDLTAVRTMLEGFLTSGAPALAGIGPSAGLGGAERALAVSA